MPFYRAFVPLWHTKSHGSTGVTQKRKEAPVRAFRAKIKNKTPCRGVIGGVRETPPDRKGRTKRKMTAALTRRSAGKVLAVNTAPHVVGTTRTVYDNANLTTNGLIRVLIVCLVFLIALMFNA